MDKIMRLGNKFSEIYALHFLESNCMQEIRTLILESLPIEVSKLIKSEGIGLNYDDPDALQLEICVLTENLEKVLISLKTRFPGFEWETKLDPNFGAIILRLDDDVLTYLPLCVSMSDEMY